MTPAPPPAARRLTPHLPIIFLLVIQLVIGLFTFRDYGLSWDEPLFYKYADALGYAYTPANWFDPNFDLNNAYGPSGDDHKTRGPAYLLLARTPVRLLESLGVDEASAWHLVNFLAFLLGVYLVYRLSLRWMSRWAAFGAAALFSTQPLLWGHAFINPKDMPFLVFFTGALVFGFEMVDGFHREEAKSAKVNKKEENKIGRALLAAFFLGIATSIRVLAPLAGILVVIYAGAQFGKLRYKLPRLFLYASIAILVMFVTWPYLWEAPLGNFIYVFRFMSENPTGLQVLFGGEIYRAFDLPRRYLPTLLAITLTEPVWPLFLLGLGSAFWRALVSIRSKNTRYSTSDSASERQLPITNYQLPATDYWLLLTAFAIPLAYVLLRQPPMYDGFRHFLFILPPVFVTCGLGLDAIFGWLEEVILALPQSTGKSLNTKVTKYTKRERRRDRTGFSFVAFPGTARQGRCVDFVFKKGNNRKTVISWLRASTILALLLPGLVAGTRLHPYEYAYYNSLVGGTGGAFRNYETDYWLTCYKEAVERFGQQPATLFVHREAYIAAAYAPSGLAVLDERGNLSAIQSGDYILVNTRSNEDRKTFHDAPVVLDVGRSGATFCLIKRIP